MYVFLNTPSHGVCVHFLSQPYISFQFPPPLFLFFLYHKFSSSLVRAGRKGGKVPYHRRVPPHKSEYD